MAYQAVFRRCEMKYMLTREQKERLLAVMAPYMEMDAFGRSAVRSLYFDTDSDRLIRRSLEKPVYKEKLRLRSYGPAGPEDKVFVELKKKYDSVVYKRRLRLVQAQALGWLGGETCPKESQIAREITYFRDFYAPLRPAALLTYDREAYAQRQGGDFRVTLDENILARGSELTLAGDVWGTPLLRPGQVLLEVKTGGGLPLWMSRFLTQNRIYQTSFSKYGSAYQRGLLQEQGGHLYA